MFKCVFRIAHREAYQVSYLSLMGLFTVILNIDRKLMAHKFRNKIMLK